MEPIIPFLWILWPGLYIVYFILSLFGAIRQYSTGINLIFSCLFLRHSFLTVDKSTVFHLFLSFFFLYHTGWLSLLSNPVTLLFTRCANSNGFCRCFHSKSAKSVTTTVSYGIFSSENAYPCTVTRLLLPSDCGCNGGKNPL